MGIETTLNGVNVDQLDALWAQVKKTSPVLDILRSPVEVTIAAAS